MGDDYHKKYNERITLDQTLNVRLQSFKSVLMQKPTQESSKCKSRTTSLPIKRKENHFYQRMRKTRQIFLERKKKNAERTLTL